MLVAIHIMTYMYMYFLPTLAANFRSLNDSIHRLLSESVDVLPQTQRSSTLPLKKVCMCVKGSELMTGMYMYMCTMLHFDYFDMVHITFTQLDSSGLKLSRSSTDINEKPVTAEDLDKVLKGLAKFRELEIR